MSRGRLSRKRVQETLAYVQDNPCLLQDLIRFERLKRWTVDLVAKVHPGNRTTAYRHLERLVRLGCLGKHGAAGKGGGGSAPAVYYLSALGARVLTHALERKQPVTYVRRTSRTQEMHDLAMTELAVDWGLLDSGWRVQVPVSYVRNQPLLNQARQYLEKLAAWKQWQEVEELQTELQSLNREMEELEYVCRQPGMSTERTKAYFRLKDAREEKEELIGDLHIAESRLKKLDPPTYPRPEQPVLPWDLAQAYDDLAAPGQSLEEWASTLQPQPAYFIPDFHACFPCQDRTDWLVCIEIEARTERRHIEDKYRRYAEARDALNDDHWLSLYVVFTSQQVAQRALPQHRRLLNILLRGPDPCLFQVRFTDLDHLSEIEGAHTPADLVWEGMEWEWKSELMDGKLRGALHEAYEEEWERQERQRRERKRKAYWAFVKQR
jgi:hypothetical protein